jgi:hypothetical protein
VRRSEKGREGAQRGAGECDGVVEVRRGAKEREGVRKSVRGCGRLIVTGGV